MPDQPFPRLADAVQEGILKSQWHGNREGLIERLRITLSALKTWLRTNQFPEGGVLGRLCSEVGIGTGQVKTAKEIVTHLQQSYSFCVTKQSPYAKEDDENEQQWLEPKCEEIFKLWDSIHRTGPQHTKKVGKLDQILERSINLTNALGANQFWIGTFTTIIPWTFTTSHGEIVNARYRSIINGALICYVMPSEAYLTDYLEMRHGIVNEPYESYQNGLKRFRDGFFAFVEKEFKNPNESLGMPPDEMWHTRFHAIETDDFPLTMPGATLNMIGERSTRSRDAVEKFVIFSPFQYLFLLLPRNPGPLKLYLETYLLSTLSAEIKRLGVIRKASQKQKWALQCVSRLRNRMKGKPDDE